MKRLKARLIPEWKEVLLYAYSVKWLIVGAIFSGLEAILPIFSTWFEMSPQRIAAITFFIIGGAFFSRFVVQKQIAEVKGGKQT